MQHVIIVNLNVLLHIVIVHEYIDIIMMQNYILNVLMVILNIAVHIMLVYHMMLVLVLPLLILGIPDLGEIVVLLVVDKLELNLELFIVKEMIEDT